MGNTMHINKEILIEKITKLNGKRNELSGYSYEKCSKNSSGLSADKLKEIELLYDDLKKEIILLYDRTSFYMEIVYQEADRMDNSIADSMNIGG